MFADELSSFRRQQLLLEYASLKHIRLKGIYVSLTSGDASNWAGVLFVRKGPYAPAIFRFRISFPSSYPHNPPLIIFNTPDIFHPLVTPPVLAGQPNTSESGTGDGHVTLPPSTLSLKHGFPAWYSKLPTSPRLETDVLTNNDNVTVAEVLRYARRCFEEEVVIDSIPFEAAVYENAWYAWRAHRVRTGKIPAPSTSTDAAADSNSSSKDASVSRRTTEVRGRAPKDWNWEGVWEERIEKAIQTSLTDVTLYGSAVSKEDDIHFLNEDQDRLNKMKAELVKGYHLSP